MIWETSKEDFENYEDAVKAREDAELKYFKEYRRDKQYE